MNMWDQLGIEPTQDLRLIKRAYSARLKVTRPDDDAQAYQDLREAYEWAQHFAKLRSSGVELDVVRPAESTATPEVMQNASVEAAEPTALVQQTDQNPGEARTHEAPVQAHVDTGLVPTLKDPTARSVLNDVATLWAQSSSTDMVAAWPRIQALLEDLPITEQNQASRLFARFVLEEPGLPVEILIALTRHFQWGLDFRVDQMLGAQLGQELYYKLRAGEVFAAFHPDRYTHHAWALSLAKLCDAKRWIVANMLATALDCKTRLQVLQAKPSTLHALGASRASAKVVPNLANNGGVAQSGLFALLVILFLSLLVSPSPTKKAMDNLFSLAITGALALGLQFYLLREFNNMIPVWRWLRRGKQLDVFAFVPLAVALIVYMDENYRLIEGSSSSPGFLGFLICLYITLWLVSPTEEYPWRKLVLPTFFLLFCGLKGAFLDMSDSMLISLASAWTLAAHTLLRKFPEQVEVVYAKFIKLNISKQSWWMLLAANFIGIFFVIAAVVMLPILLFRMTKFYRPLYAGIAIYVGALLANASNTDDPMKGLLYWVLATVLCIQILQWLSQRMASFYLKKLGL